jgi:intein-encoded DNA endonuclease-like protein
MVTEFIKDYRKGLYAAQITKKFNLSDSTVRRHLKKRNIKMKPRGKRQEILPTVQIITPEKAYIMGVVGPGDGFIEYNKNSKRICLETIDKDFANFFAFCLKKTYGLKPKIKVLKPRPTDTTTHYKVTLCSVAACEDLLRYEVSYKEENWRVPKEIKEASEEIKCMYLRGIADSQGSVCHSGSVRWIELSSKNTTGLKEIGDLLKELNIVDWYIHKNGLRITARRSLLLFAQKVGFTIERKRITLTNLLNSYKVWKTPEKETIKLMPEILRLKRSRSNSLEIAKKLGVHPSTIYNYLRKLNKKDSPEQIEWIGIKR